MITHPISPPPSNNNSNLQVYEIMMKALCTTAQLERQFLFENWGVFKFKMGNMQLNQNLELGKIKEQLTNKSQQLEKEKQQLFTDFHAFAPQFKRKLTDINQSINDLINGLKAELSVLKETVIKHSTESFTLLSSQIKEMKDQIDQKEQERHNKDNSFQQLLTENHFLSIQVKEKNEEIRLQREILAKQMTIAKKENEKQIDNLAALHKEEIDNLILLMSEK